MTSFSSMDDRGTGQLHDKSSVSQSRRDASVAASKSYMHQHELPLAIENALLQVVPSRHPHPHEVLNQSVWLPLSAAFSKGPGAMERRMEIKGLCDTARQYRSFLSAQGNHKQESIDGSISMGSSVAPSPGKILTIDELLQLRRELASKKVNCTIDGVTATTSGGEGGRHDESAPLISPRSPSFSSSTPSQQHPASPPPRLEASSFGASSSGLLNVDAKMARVHALALAINSGSSDFDVFAALVDPFLTMARHANADGAQTPMASPPRSFLRSSESPQQRLCDPSSSPTTAAVTSQVSSSIDVNAILCAFLIFEQHHLLRRLRIPDDVFFTWVVKVFENHHSISIDSPFFNFYQSLGVLQRCHIYVRQLLSSGSSSSSSPFAFVACSGAENIFSLFFSAINSHVQHPGPLTNDELCRMSSSSGRLHPLALRYNDQAPIQQNAASIAFALLSEFGAQPAGKIASEAATSDAAAAVPSSSGLDMITCLCAEHDGPVMTSSPLFPDGRSSPPLSSLRFASFRRLALSLMLSPNEPPRPHHHHQQPSASTTFSVEEVLKAIYLTAYHGWFQQPQGGSSCGKISASSRWKDLLRLQVQRYGVQPVPSSSSSSTPLQRAFGTAPLTASPPGSILSALSSSSGARVSGMGSFSSNETERWTAFIRNAEESYEAALRDLRSYFP